MRAGSSLSRGGVEIDKVSRASPRRVQVLVEIPNLFGPGMTAQMTYYEARSGAGVFAAGAFYFTRVINRDPGVARMMDNLWAHTSSGLATSSGGSPRAHQRPSCNGSRWRDFELVDRGIAVPPEGLRP